MPPDRLRFTVLGTGLLTLLAVAGWAGGWLWRAQSTLATLRDQSVAAGSLEVTVRDLVPNLPAGLEMPATPAVYSDAQVFNGTLYLAGPAGLFTWEGNLKQTYRAGLELPPAPVTALAVGAAGQGQQLWLATAGEGLVSFDGRGFRHIRPRDPAAAKITALLPVSTGRILLGTEKRGVLVWDGSRLSEFHTALSNVRITALAGDDTDLWAGTLDQGLLHWHAGALERITGLPDARILALAKEGETVYTGTAAGVAEVRNGAAIRVLAPGYFAQALHVAGRKLWIGTLEEGAFELDLDARAGRGAEARRARVCQDCSIRKIFAADSALFTLADNSLWRGDEEVLGAAASTLRDRNISALASDASGRLWIGYFDHGLQVLDARGGRGMSLEDDNLFCVNRIVHDAGRGTTLVATANGLVMLDAAAQKRRVLTSADGLIANQISDVALRPDGSMIAATPAGLSFIDASGISSLYAFQGLVNNHVYALGVSGTRTLAGTLGGLSVLDAGFVKASYTTANSALGHNWITAILPAGNQFFVGTYGAGVLKFDALGRWEAFDDLRGANLEINANAMTASEHAVYAGTLDRGIAVYNVSSQRWNYWTRGLPSRNVTAVEARGGYLNIGTDNGLVRIPETTVLAQ